MYYQPAIDEEWLERRNEWSDRTFGTGDRTDYILHHIETELDEVRQAPDDVYEWVDIILLALDGAWRAGHNPNRVLGALRLKAEFNTTRTWRKDDSGLLVTDTKEQTNQTSPRPDRPRDPAGGDAAACAATCVGVFGGHRGSGGDGEERPGDDVDVYSAYYRDGRGADGGE